MSRRKIHKRDCKVPVFKELNQIKYGFLNLLLKKMHSKASNEKSKAIWIPKSLLKDLNIENKSKLTFKLPKASTPSSSQHLPKKVLKPYTPPSSKIIPPPRTSKPHTIVGYNWLIAWLSLMLHKCHISHQC